MLRAGFIGLGDMGGRMARRILAANWPLAVYDMRPEAVAALEAEGATAPGSVAAVGAAADLIGICVATDAQVRSVCLNLMSSLDSSKIVLIHSSIAPQAVRDIAAALAETGATVLDAPVSGSRPAADNGTLTLILGGDPASVEVVRPLLNSYSKNIFHAGTVGAGEAVKLANNVMLHMNHLLALEALRFARSQGISEQLLMEVANVSTGRSWVTETWGLIDQMLVDHPQAGSDRILDMMAKDMRESVVAAQSTHTPMPLTALGVELSRGYFRERIADLGRELPGTFRSSVSH
jgi:3-hydroxyisobutyrate dehydrogenase